MKTATTLITFLVLAARFVAAESVVQTTNVLLIMADDLRELGDAFTRAVVKTPNLGRLAARGVRFERAYAQYPVCNPSRTSMLLGLRCEQTGIVGNQQFFRATLPEAVTFPQLLRQHGWTTHSFGKVLHAANTGEAVRDQWLKLWEITLVIFLGDHGYHLGERGWWNKNTLFDRSCRAPLLIAAPGAKGGQVCRSPVEFVDLYATIADCCGLTAPHRLAGQSLRPVLADPARPHKEAAFSLVTRGPQRFGRTVTTARWRFTQWSDGATELYDHHADPEETRDVSADEANAPVVAELRQKLASLPPWPAPAGN